MWPGCKKCGASVPESSDDYCGGNKCVGKQAAFNASAHSPYTKKKLTKAMIKARRKKGRK